MNDPILGLVSYNDLKKICDSAGFKAAYESYLKGEVLFTEVVQQFVASAPKDGRIANKVVIEVRDVTPKTSSRKPRRNTKPSAPKLTEGVTIKELTWYFELITSVQKNMSETRVYVGNRVSLERLLQSSTGIAFQNSYLGLLETWNDLKKYAIFADKYQFFRRYLRHFFILLGKREFSWTKLRNVDMETKIMGILDKQVNLSESEYSAYEEYMMECYCNLRQNGLTVRAIKADYKKAWSFYLGFRKIREYVITEELLPELRANYDLPEFELIKNAEDIFDTFDVENLAKLIEKWVTKQIQEFQSRNSSGAVNIPLELWFMEGEHGAEIYKKVTKKGVI